MEEEQMEVLEKVVEEVGVVVDILLKEEMIVEAEVVMEKEEMVDKVVDMELEVEEEDLEVVVL